MSQQKNKQLPLFANKGSCLFYDFKKPIGIVAIERVLLEQPYARFITRF